MKSDISLTDLLKEVSEADELDSDVRITCTKGFKVSAAHYKRLHHTLSTIQRSINEWKVELNRYGEINGLPSVLQTDKVRMHWRKLGAKVGRTLAEIYKDEAAGNPALMKFFDDCRTIYDAQPVEGNRRTIVVNHND